MADWLLAAGTRSSAAEQRLAGRRAASGARLKPDVRHDMQPDLNHVLKVYLGADANGGYEPLYRDERLRQAFPDTYLQMMKLIAPYLDEDQEPDWAMGDLIRQAERFEAALRQKFPELDATAARALANRWHFGWSR